MRFQEIGLRILALVLILVTILLDAKHIQRIIFIPWVQVLIAFMMILVIIADPLSGLFFGIAGMVVYLRVNDAMRPNEKVVRREGDYDIVKTPFVTAENLQSAQTNVFNKKEYDTGIKGISGVYGEPVYGAQGLDKEMPGYASFL